MVGIHWSNYLLLILLVFWLLHMICGICIILPVVEPRSRWLVGSSSHWFSQTESPCVSGNALLIYDFIIYTCVLFVFSYSTT